MGQFLGTARRLWALARPAAPLALLAFDRVVAKDVRCRFVLDNSALPRPGA